MDFEDIKKLPKKLKGNLCPTCQTRKVFDSAGKTQSFHELFNNNLYLRSFQQQYLKAKSTTTNQTIQCITTYHLVATALQFFEPTIHQNYLFDIQIQYIILIFMSTKDKQSRKKAQIPAYVLPIVVIGIACIVLLLVSIASLSYLLRQDFYLTQKAFKKVTSYQIKQSMFTICLGFALFEVSFFTFLNIMMAACSRLLGRHSALVVQEPKYLRIFNRNISHNIEQTFVFVGIYTFWVWLTNPSDSLMFSISLAFVVGRFLFNAGYILGNLMKEPVLRSFGLNINFLIVFVMLIQICGYNAFASFKSLPI